MLTLTADELRELTGKHRSDAQRRALIRMGLTFRQRPDHSLAVLRAHVQAVLGGAVAKPPEREPSYSDEWRPWIGTNMTPQAWFEKNLSSFTHGPDAVRARLMAPDAVPNISGIYFLYNDGELAYIGESVSTSYRFSQHAEGKEFDAAWAFRVPELYRVELEAAYIDAIEPPLNVRYRPANKHLVDAIRPLWRSGC